MIYSPMRLVVVVPLQEPADVLRRFACTGFMPALRWNKRCSDHGNSEPVA